MPAPVEAQPVEEQPQEPRTPVTRAGDQPIKKGPTPFEEPGVDKAWYTPEFKFDDRFIPWDYKLWGATAPAEVVKAPVVVPKVEVLAPVRGPAPVIAAPVAPARAAPGFITPGFKAPAPVVAPRLANGPVVLRP